MDNEIETEVEDKQVIGTASKAGLVLFITSIIAIIFIITTRQPGLGGPITVLIFLALVFVGGIGLFLLVYELISRMFKLKKFSNLRLFYTSVLLSLGLVCLIGLQTLGQLQVVDVVLVATFEILLNFYLLRRF